MTGSEPRRLGRYELLELLGHGAMGVVYKAHDSFLDRVVAVKTYRQDIPITQNVKTRFEREVKTASKLVHPNIVVVYDGGLEQDVPYLAMEYIEGPTLAAELSRRGRLPVDEALALIAGIADGLAYAHSQGVVHRDLKPANILLAGGKNPKIADFGVAKLMSAQSAVTTTAVGTPSYMAPEQIEGRPVDARSDVFALAILSYELVTGVPPFAGEGWTAVLFQIMNVEPERPSKLDPALPQAVDAVFATALAKDVNQRTPDVPTFARELREAFSPAKRAEPSPPPPLPPPPPAPRARPREEPHDPIDAGAFDAFRDLAPRGKEPSIAGPAIAVILLLVGILGMILHLRNARRSPAPEIEGTPIAMATSAPTEAPATPLPRPTAKPPPRPTEPPRVEPTAVPRVQPTAPPRVEPTPVPARPTPIPARPRPTIAQEPMMAPTAVPPVVTTNKPTIDVISDPPGADVVVNGAVKGRTPFRISDLDPGSYDFEIRKQGYNTYRKTTQVDADSDYTMKVTLPQTVNSLRVISQPPGVTVKVNGEIKGNTPLTLSQLANGHYQVSGSLEGFPEQTMGIDLKDGELQEVRFRFGASADQHPPNP